MFESSVIQIALNRMSKEHGKFQKYTTIIFLRNEKGQWQCLSVNYRQTGQKHTYSIVNGNFKIANLILRRKLRGSNEQDRHLLEAGTFGSQECHDFVRFFKRFN